MGEHVPDVTLAALLLTAALAAAGSAAAASPDKAAPAPANPSAPQLRAQYQPDAPTHPGARYAPPRWLDPMGWEPPLVEGFDVLLPDNAPLPLSYYVPAGGPAQRHTSRPGAWYAAVFLPMAPRWPVQVWISQRVRTHELRVLALDASPVGAASVVVPLPLGAAQGPGRLSLATAPVMLPATSQADGVFLLFEQWSVAGDRPAPIWVQARTRIRRDDTRVPWWQSRSPPEYGPPVDGLAPNPPASPLNTPRWYADVIELPIQRRLHTP